MERSFDTGIEYIQSQLLAMAGHLENALAAAISAWKDRNPAKVQQVHAIEQKVNRAHLVVDAECVELIALEHPFATDLRRVIAIIRMNNDLERMVDLAVNIANNTEYYLKNPHTVSTDKLVTMATQVQVMVRGAIDAFVERSEPLAEGVFAVEKDVDRFKDEIFREMLALAQAKPALVEQVVNIILIARNLERIGDHATNIAEEVIYAVSGKDVRHPSLKSSDDKG